MKSPANPKKTHNGFEQSKWYVPAAFAFMMLGLIFLFRDFLFSGQMLYGSDTVTAGIFHRSFLIDHFKETGQIPQWNPYAYGGMPYVDAFHGDIFYPLSVLKFFLPLYFYLGFNLVMHIFLAGIFMYLAARQFKLGKTAALISATCYMFAPCLVSLVASGHDGKIYSSALFPLVVLFLDRAFETKPFLNFTILGMILGIIILSPQPETSYFTFWVVGLFALFKLIVLWRQTKLFRAIIKPGLLIVYAVILALLLSAIQFYPGYTYAAESSARIVHEDRWTWATSWSMHEEETFSQLIPEFCGTMFPRLPFLKTELNQSSYWGKNHFKDNSDSVGVVAIFLSLSCFFFARRKEAYFFGALAIFAFIYALGSTTPLFKVFYDLVPKVSLLRGPSKILFIFSFSISLLAGMGVQAIIDRRKVASAYGEKPFNVLMFGFPAFLLVLAVLFSITAKEILSVWTSLFFPEASTTPGGHGISKFVLAIQNMPEIKHGAWMAFAVIFLAALSIWIFLKRKASVVLLSLLILLPIFDGIRFNRRFVEVIDPSFFFVQHELINFFKAQKGQFRVLSHSSDLPKSLLPQYGIELVTGYHGNQLRCFDDLLGGPHFKNISNPRFLNLVGARFVIIPARPLLEENYFGEIPAKPVAYFGQNQLVRNDNAFERVYLVNKYRVIYQLRHMRLLIVDGTEDLKQIVYLETLPSISIPPDNLALDSVWTISRGLDSVVIGVNCTSNRLLVLTDNYYDSWHAYIDGKPVEILRAYSTFRTVAVPADAKEVKFIYKSQRYAVGKFITGTTSIYLLLVFGYCTWKNLFHRRPKQAP